MKRLVCIPLVLFLILLISSPNVTVAKEDVIELKITYHHSPTHLIARSIKAA